jgi:seipin
VLFTGLTLLGFAITAYIFFYYAYIPERGFSKPVYLQFDQGRNAYAEVDLGNGRLVSDQPYDIDVKLHVPRTPANMAAGNFMIQLELVAPPESRWTDEVPKVLVQERRPAILTYYSTALEHVYNAARLPLLVTGWRKEAEKLDISIMEGVEFARGWRNVPATARIELQSTSHLQVYDMSISFRTRLRGLRYVNCQSVALLHILTKHRYLMYNYRLTTFVVLTSIFWAVEMTIAGLLWVSLPLIFQGTNQDLANQDLDIKQEAESTTGTVETPGDQQFALTPIKVKKEESQEPSLETYPATAEGDVEDEGEDDDEAVVVQDIHGAAPSDSGIGTSMESSARRETVRRRSIKNMREE